MRALSDLIPWPIRWTIGLGTVVSLTWGTIEARFDAKVYASENRMIERVDAYRKEDMAVIRAIKDNTDLLLRHALDNKKQTGK